MKIFLKSSKTVTKFFLIASSSILFSEGAELTIPEGVFPKVVKPNEITKEEATQEAVKPEEKNSEVAKPDEVIPPPEKEALSSQQEVTYYEPETKYSDEEKRYSRPNNVEEPSDGLACCDNYHMAPNCQYDAYNCCDTVVCDQDCCGRFLVFGDFLYWYARETELSYALELKTQFIGPDPNLLIEYPGQYEYFGTRWDPGFRVGAGYITENCTDFIVNWTYFKNRKKNSIKFPLFDTFFTDPDGQAFPGNDTKVILNPWVNIGLYGANNSAILYDRVSAKWELKLNYADVQFGYTYCGGKCFTFRPYFGGRGIWSDTEFETNSNYGPAVYIDVPDFQQTSENVFKNCYWGGGVLAGFQPAIKSGCFSLFGNFDAALVWGKAKGEKWEKELVTEGEEIVINVRDDSDFSFFRMQPIVDLAIGLRYELFFGCDCSCRFAINFGWEQHIWFDHNLRIKSSTGFFFPSSDMIPSWRGFKQYEEVMGDLTFGGIFIGAELEF